jgi:hypothetical protein
MITGWPLKDRATFDAIIGMARETDRAAAILAGTLLEDHLERKLKSELRNSSVTGQLFDVGRPLAFFAAQNQLAYVMKIYGRPFYQEMHIVSQIRNNFAHFYADKEGPFISDFKSPVIAKLTDELQLITPLLEKNLRYAKGLEHTQEEVSSILDDPKRKYLETCALCACALNGSLDSEILAAIWADNYPPPPNWRPNDGIT